MSNYILIQKATCFALDQPLRQGPEQVGVNFKILNLLNYSEYKLVPHQLGTLLAVVTAANHSIVMQRTYIDKTVKLYIDIRAILLLHEEWILCLPNSNCKRGRGPCSARRQTLNQYLAARSARRIRRSTWLSTTEAKDMQRAIPGACTPVAACLL